MQAKYVNHDFYSASIFLWTSCIECSMFVLTLFVIICRRNTRSCTCTCEFGPLLISVPSELRHDAARRSHESTTPDFDQGIGVCYNHQCLANFCLQQDRQAHGPAAAQTVKYRRARRKIHQECEARTIKELDILDFKCQI
jgi:hypothetical protein